MGRYCCPAESDRVVGAALLPPAALSLVVRLFEGQECNRALRIWA